MRNIDDYMRTLRNTKEYESASDIISEEVFSDMVDDVEEELDEMNVTGNVAGYNTPGAFSATTDEDEHQTLMSSNAEQLGYRYPSDVEKKKRNTVKLENRSEFYQLANHMHLSEETYRQFKGNDDMSSKQKINMRIKEINGAIYKIEQMVEQAHKLKFETNIDQSQLWEKSKVKLERIAKRLNNLSRKIVDLGV